MHTYTNFYSDCDNNHGTNEELEEIVERPGLSMRNQASTNSDNEYDHLDIVKCES